MKRSLSHLRALTVWHNKWEDCWHEIFICKRRWTRVVSILLLEFLCQALKFFASTGLEMMLRLKAYGKLLTAMNKILAVLLKEAYSVPPRHWFTHIKLHLITSTRSNYSIIWWSKRDDIRGNRLSRIGSKSSEISPLLSCHICKEKKQYRRGKYQRLFWHIKRYKN